MAWVEGTEEQEFDVKGDPSDVSDYFANPARFSAAFSQLEKHEKIDDTTWRWTLVEKNEKGVHFQGCYTVRYERTPDGARWETVDGNMKTTGYVTCKASGNGTRVRYHETLAVDLPIPRLAAKLFQPIVAREIRGGVGDFLHRSRKILDSNS